MGQLITQVSGRAGRATRKGQVILQTHHPEHPVIQKILQQNYPDFSKHLLNQRQIAKLPPFSFLTLISAQAIVPEKAQNFLFNIRKLLETFTTKELQTMGPIPAPMEKKQGRYRFQLLIQSSQRKQLHDALSKLTNQIPLMPDANKLRWSIDVDPIDFI